MRLGIGKRGVSAVIASVLLILLVTIVSVSIFSWSKGFFEEKTADTGELNGKSCSSVNFLASIVAVPDVSYYNVNIVNSGNVDIDAFDFKVYYSNGNSKVIRNDTGVPFSGANTIDIDFPSLGSEVIIESIEVLPILKGDDGNSGELGCGEDLVYLDLSDTTLTMSPI